VNRTDRIRWQRVRHRAGTVVFALVAVAGGPVRPATAQAAQAPVSVTHGADLVIEWDGPDTDPVVRLRLDIEVAPGTRAIPLRGLEFSGAIPADVSASADGAPLVVRMDQTRASPLVEGEVELPSGRGDAGIEIEIRYRVLAATVVDDGESTVAVPLLLPEWKTAGSTGDVFRAQIRIPPEYHIAEVFPTVPAQVTEDDRGKVYAISIPAIPALVRFDSGIGPAPLLGFTRSIDLLLFGLIAALALLGARQLRSTAREA
jgi:hypothetical protein